MYEHRTHQLLAWPAFLRRAARHMAWGLLAILAAVTMGTVGYHLLGRLAWIDAFLNASMILGGMGPVDRMEATSGKLFSSFYALFSGLFFIGILGLVIAPWVHRMIHVIHAEEDQE
jgi:hypothetical protein